MQEEDCRKFREQERAFRAVVAFGSEAPFGLSSGSKTGSKRPRADKCTSQDNEVSDYTAPETAATGCSTDSASARRDISARICAALSVEERISMARSKSRNS